MNESKNLKTIRDQQLQQLRSLAQQKGFVTPQDLNQLSGTGQSEELEELIRLCREDGIRVRESEGKNNLSAFDFSPSPSLSPAAEEPIGYGRTDDPVRVYLRQMGEVDLLDREGEVEIAKKIEEGQALVRRAALESPIAARHICYEISRLLENGVRYKLLFVEEEVEEPTLDEDEEGEVGDDGVALDTLETKDISNSTDAKSEREVAAQEKDMQMAIKSLNNCNH